MHNVLNEIVIYSTNTCSYCIRAKELLNAKKVAFREIYLDNEPEKGFEMMQKTGRKTVPQIFIGDYHVGGFDDLKRLNESGQLDLLLSQYVKKEI